MKKLETILLYVSEHNSFYKNRIKEYGIKNPLDITQWPILTRKELQENRYNMFSDGYKTRYFNQQLRRQSSSGSTGIPINVYWDYKDWYASNICLWRKRQVWYGIKPNDKYCIFTLGTYGTTPQGKELYFINDPSNVLSFNVSLICDNNGYECVAEIINDFKPTWLYIQPFVLNHLIVAYTKLRIVPPETIKYIESVGEVLSSDLRKKAERFFHIKITNMYGSEEMNGIAIENPLGSMRILSDNVFLEVANDNGIENAGSGESIITNLNNYAMPLIRYQQGDRIAIKDNVILGIEGRSINDIIINGSHLNTVFLCEIVNRFNNEFKDILLDYHFVYEKDCNQITIYVDNCLANYFNTIRNYFANFITMFFPDCQVRIDVFHDIYSKREILKIV